MVDQGLVGDWYASDFKFGDKSFRSAWTPPDWAILSVSNRMLSDENALRNEGVPPENVFYWDMYEAVFRPMLPHPKPARCPLCGGTGKHP